MSADTKTAATTPSTRGSASTTYEVDDAFAANELYQDNGWTDGLPIVPPTEKLVRACLDAARPGHAGKYTYCVAEDEEDHPWTPLATERGVPAGQSAVTVLAAGSSHQLMNEWTRDPRELLETYAATMRANLLTYSIWAGNYAIVV